ncbi:putative exodeoxyribonuclease III [Mycobacterium xenopi 4042]|uniref:Putative exodeoxyribonuclease III n=1 Tax=Mycobacterium xenopi 4042 TaxID=1299334 RepID=X8DK30_MYCXE|nr:putative exodeoxyribonuclease III [Mycobacterium xenopi 4042]
MWSLYVPNGRALNDPHYTYKLNWLAALRDTAETWLREDSSAQIALAGDWNIAPTDDDVWSIEFYRAAPMSPNPNAKRSTPSLTPNSPMWYGLSLPARASTPTGTTPRCASRKARGCVSTSSSLHRHWRSGSSTRESCARSARARRPATTLRLWWICAAIELITSCGSAACSLAVGRAIYR